MPFLDASTAEVSESKPSPSQAAIIERYFEFSLYLLVVTGFATLATTGKLDALSTLFVSAALIARGYLLFHNRRVLIPERWTTYFTLLYVVFYALDFLFLSGNFVSATVHLVLFSMVVKIFSVQRDRDHLYLAILAFLEVLAAAVLTVDSVFLIAFCVFMLLAVTTFISMEMKRSAASAAHAAQGPAGWISPRMRNGATPRAAPSLRVRLREMPAALSLTGVAIMLSIFVGSAVIFFLLPRVSAGYLGAFAPRNEFVTGFSNDVNLGQIGVIQQSSTVVMHVTLESGDVDILSLKWRGTALEKFDGQRWYGSNWVPQTLFRSIDGSFNLAVYRQYWRRRFGEDIARRSRTIRYKVLMEPLGMSVFFLAPTADFIFGNYRSVNVDSDGAVYNNDRDRPITAYQAVSNTGEPSAQELQTASRDYPPQVLDHYLQLPTYLDARIPGLAGRITAGAPTPYDKARTLERYLQTNFGYTLQLPSAPVSDPLANFLFERKQGHCEFFASSMAIMLRTLGIPSRIVNGFRGGEYNDVTGSYIIRARDAHSWVEAYFPGNGWVSFDPTPAGSTPPAATGWNRMALYLDAMREFWREWVVNYDFSHQRTLSTQVVSRSRTMVDDGRRWLRRQYFSLLHRAQRVREDATHAPGKWAGITLGVLLLATLLFNVGRLRRLWQRRRLLAAPEREPRAAAGIWYLRMARTVARRGWRKQPAQSPREFVVSIEDPELRRQVENFTRSYERARFGGSADDARELPELYEEINSK